jgi:hypothetical protein
LKSTIDSLSIVSLKDVIRSIETGGKTNPDPKQLRKLVANVLDVMQKVIQQVKNEL